MPKTNCLCQLLNTDNCLKLAPAAQFGSLESVRVFPGKTFAFVNFLDIASEWLELLYIGAGVLCQRGGCVSVLAALIQ